MISGKMMTKILCWNFEKSFLKWEKMVPRKIFRHFLRANFFIFTLLISNHTVFLVQFGVNLHLSVFQKAEITLAEAARAISAFWKTHLCKLIPNWTRNRMTTYTKSLHNVFKKILCNSRACKFWSATCSFMPCLRTLMLDVSAILKRPTSSR